MFPSHLSISWKSCVKIDTLCNWGRNEIKVVIWLDWVTDTQILVLCLSVQAIGIGDSDKRNFILLRVEVISGIRHLLLFIIIQGFRLLDVWVNIISLLFVLFFHVSHFRRRRFEEWILINQINLLAFLSLLHFSIGYGY